MKGMLLELHNHARKSQKLIMHLHSVCQINSPRSCRRMKQADLTEVYFMTDNAAGVSYYRL